MDFQQLLDTFGGAVEQGDGWLAHCPAHSDSQASLRIAVTPEGKALLKCRAACPTERVLEAVGLTFAHLSNVTNIGERTISEQRDEPLSTADIAGLRLQLDGYAENFTANSASAEYVSSRFGLSFDDASRLGIGAAHDLPGGERVVVPFFGIDGIARGFQARALDADARVRWWGPRNPQAGSWTRVGYFRGRGNWPEVIITEGPSDALTAVGAGYDALAIRGAGLASKSLAAEISEMLPGRLFVLAGDGDPAGRAFSTNLASFLVESGAHVRVIDVPDGSDLTQWRSDDPVNFAGMLQQVVKSAQPVSSTEATLLRRPESLYPLTDLGNARFVADMAEAKGNALRYVDELGFLILHDGVWFADRLDRSRAMVQEAAVLVEDIANTLVDAAGKDTNLLAEAHRWKRWAQYCQSKRGIDAVLSEIKPLPKVATSIESLDRHHHLLAVRNGVIDLRTGELLEHDPALLLTKRLRINYDPAATAPRWEQYLSEVMVEDERMVKYLQRLVGYGITGETDEQCFAVLWGSGSNGKSVFTSTLTEVFRAITQTTPFSTFEAKPSGGIPNDLAALRAARLVFASEGEADKPMAEALLKRVTGKDEIAARFLRREFFTFKPVMMLFLATNNKPAFRGADDGLWRRVKLIEWRRRFTAKDQDHKLESKLLAEAEGILAWAVRGSVEWYANGLQDPEPIVNATQEYRVTSDPLSGFIGGVFIFDRDARGVLGKDIFEAYRKWADDENLKLNEIVTRRKFFSMLEERGLKKRSVTAGVAFDGIRRGRPSDFSEEDAAVLMPEAVQRPLVVKGGFDPSAVRL